MNKSKKKPEKLHRRVVNSELETDGDKNAEMRKSDVTNAKTRCKFNI